MSGQPSTPAKRDFLRLRDLTLAEHRKLFDAAARHKSLRRARAVDARNLSLLGRTLCLVFEKPSTRTRLSFEAAMFQLGGNALTLPWGDSQLARGEPIRDTARVLSGYVDAIVVRTFGDDRLAEFAVAATVPVINGLSDGGHPVQLLADLFTIEERLGSLQNRVVAFVGDGSSNMAWSWVEAAGLFGFELRIASPPGYQAAVLGNSAADAARVKLTPDPAAAVRGADVIATDVWTSMGQEAEGALRRSAFTSHFCVDDALVARAEPNVVILHCLPAHRGEEITEAVLEGPHSAVFEEAENRLHVQKALIEGLLGVSQRA